MPFICPTDPAPAEAADNDPSAFGNTIVHMEEHLASVDLTGIPIWTNGPAGISTSLGVVSNVQSVLFRNYHGGGAIGRRWMTGQIEMPPGVTILGWIVDAGPGTSYIPDTDPVFSPLGAVPAFPTGSSSAFNRKYEAWWPDWVQVNSATSATVQNRFSSHLDDARMLIQYDPATIGVASWTLDLTTAPGLQDLTLCAVDQPGLGVHTIPLTAVDGDQDGDGFGICGDADCNDLDASVYPGAPDVCDALDNDCDGVTDNNFDNDDDGVTTCGPDGVDATTDDNDCDDTEPLNAPGFAEFCDEIDNDCDGDVDEGYDTDGDGLPDCGAPGSQYQQICSGDVSWPLIVMPSNSAATPAWHHAAWSTLLHPFGAVWMSDTYIETTPVVGGFNWFQLNVPVYPGATIDQAVLWFTADNDYVVQVTDGTGAAAGTIASNLSGWAPSGNPLFGEIYSVDLTGALSPGVNELDFLVNNFAQPGGNQWSNPTGVYYCLDLWTSL